MIYDLSKIATIPMTLSDLQDHSRVTSFQMGFFTVVQQLTRFQLTQRVARFLCHSCASCWSESNHTGQVLCIRWRSGRGDFSPYRKPTWIWNFRLSLCHGRPSKQLLSSCLLCQWKKAAQRSKLLSLLSLLLIA